jgi:molybdopterin-biosynthesis enzyme MoeA-like protein
MTIRRATIRTESEHATVIADALRPDNTDEMETVTDESESTIETVIERETTGGLRTTADDYVTNLTVAAQLTNDTNTNHE